MPLITYQQKAQLVRLYYLNGENAQAAINAYRRETGVRNILFGVRNLGTLLMAFSKFNAKSDKTITNSFKQNLKLVGSWHQQAHSPFSCYFLADNSPAAYDKTRSLSATQARFIVKF